MWRYVCDPYEDPDCGCCDEATYMPDEDMAYEESRDEKAGFNDCGEDGCRIVYPETTINQLFDEAVEAADIDG